MVITKYERCLRKENNSYAEIRMKITVTLKSSGDVAQF